MDKQLLLEAKEIIQNLKSYGMIHTVKGVVYPSGSHDFFINKASVWLNKVKNIK